MKKIISAILLVCILVSLAACGAAEADYKLGMGIVLSTDSSKTAKAQVDATVAAVVLDKDGKIVSCRLDCAQNKMDVTGGAVDTAAAFKTKMELGADYGMVAYGNAVAEWDAQAKAFTDYVVGKTAAEVRGMETTVNAEGHSVTVDATLLASCTMSISGMMAVVAQAADYAR